MTDLRHQGSDARPNPTASAAVALSAPYYGASLPVAFGRFWRKYATFTGRASRSEYWYWTLCNFVLWAVIAGLALGLPGASGATGGNMPGPEFFAMAAVGAAWWLATLVPNLAIGWRRLHDANLAGPFLFLMLIPSVGTVIIIFLMQKPSDPAGARFDHQPAGAPRPRMSGARG